MKKRSVRQFALVSTLFFKPTDLEGGMMYIITAKSHIKVFQENISEKVFLQVFCCISRTLKNKKILLIWFQDMVHKNT